jgi:hypothetical protein
MDRQGATIVNPQFAWARPFYNGLAVVGIDGKEGFLDEHGDIRIKPQFDEAESFSGKLAPVRVGRKWGFVDGTGRMIVEPQFQAAASFHDGLARILVWERLDCGNQEFTKDSAKEGEFTFHKGDLVLCRPIDGKLGFIDEGGNLVVPPQYQHAEDASDGLALVQIGEGRESRRGYVDSTGALVIPPRFLGARSFSEGLAAATLGGKWGYIDKSGEFAIAPEYYSAFPFQDGIAEVVGPTNAIDKAGKDVSGPLKQQPAPTFVNGIGIVGRGGHAVYIDAAGREIARYD